MSINTVIQHLPTMQQILKSVPLQISAANSLGDLDAAYEGYVSDIGFSHGRYTILRGTCSVRLEDIIHSHSFPDGPATWRQEYIKKKYYLLDRSMLVPHQSKQHILEWADIARHIGKSNHAVKDVIQRIKELTKTHTLQGAVARAIRLQII